MLLAIDVGNTNTVIGIYKGKTRAGIWRIRTVEDTTADEYKIMLYNLAEMDKIPLSRFDGVIISCVVPP